MATAYTSLLGLALPVTGELSGTWGNVVNDEITSLLDSAIAGATSLDVTAGNITMTDNDGAADQARSAILLVTGTPGTSRNIVAPSRSKAYIVINGSDGAVVVKGSATTGVSIGAGQKALVAWNGSDFVWVGGTEIANTSGTLASTRGGTGQSSYSAGDTLYYAAGTTLSKLTIGSNGFVMTSTGSAPQWSDTSSLTVGTATNAVNVGTTATTTNATYYMGFVASNTGNNPVNVATDFTYNPSTKVLTGTNIQLNTQGDLRFADSDSSNYVAFQAPSTVASNVTWTLPGADGTSGQVLSTDGAGTLSWSAGGGGGVSVGKAVAISMIFGF